MKMLDRRAIENETETLGQLLDRWELMNNDLRSYIKKYDFAFYIAMQELYRLVAK
jgi:hypothetical protein